MIIRTFFNRSIFLAVLSVFLVFDTGAVKSDSRADAQAALESGDFELALENFLAVVEDDPADMEAMDMVIMLAMDAGMPELSQQMLLLQETIAVSNPDKSQLQEIHKDLSEINSSVPGWIAESLASVSAVEGDQVDIQEAILVMSGEASELLEAQSFEEAVSTQADTLALAEDMLGVEHWLTVAATRDLGYAYRQLGMADEADGYYNQAIAVASVTLGEEHPLTLEIYELLAELYSAVGALDESMAISEVVIAALTSSLGERHKKTIDARLNLVNNLESSSYYDLAQDLIEDICLTVEGNYGVWHSRTLNCLLKQADLWATTSNLSEAETMYTTVIQRMGEAYPTINAQVLGTLSQLAEINRQQGKYQEAITLLSGIIQSASQIGEVEVSFVAKSYLGRVFNNLSELDKAEMLTREVIAHGLVNWQNRPLDIYNTMVELGAINQHQGKLLEAEKAYNRAFEGLLPLVGEYHPSTLTVLNNLGQVYEEGGMYDKAEPVLKQALAGYQETLGEGNQQTSRARNNLALLYESQGNFREAEPLYKESLAFLIETQGEEFTDTIAVRNNLAFLYMLMEEFDQSAEMFELVLEQWMVLFGENHQATLKALNNLGRIYHKLDRLDEAEQLVLQALEIRRSTLGGEHPDVVRSMVDLGAIYLDEDRLGEAETTLREALALAEKVLGNQHPYTFEALNNLAKVKEAQNQLQAAVELRQIGFSRRSKFLDRMLWVTGENAREGYIRLHRPEFNDFLSLLTRLDGGTGGKLAIGASLQRKGLLLKVTSEIQQISKLSLDPELSGISEQLRNIRKDLAALTLSGPTPETKGRHPQALYALEQQVNELQGQLGRASVRYRSSIAQIDVELLAASLPDSTVLVDFLTYEEGDSQKLLAGIAVKEGEDVRYELVRYPNRQEIDKAIIEYREIIQDDQADEDELLEIGEIAYELIWQPIYDVIGEADYVYLIPDGMLNILPFNAMVDPDEEYLIQTVDLHILTSGRDLLPSEYKLSQGEYVILAGPDYNSDEVVSREVLDAAEGRRSAALQLGIRGAGGGLRGLNFAPLPGAEKEGRIISEQIKKSQAPNEVFFGLDAQEQVLSSLQQPPEILHLATHGFFLKADDTLKKRLLKLQRGADIHVPPPGDNPLLRAGLAFAGINANAQFLGDIDTLNDGVLTALEVLDLNLSGTKLVVLSACETGLGEIHDGEGVYGLRRAFQEAGVAEVVSSLWEVSDAGTQALMTDFYDKLLAGVPARDALRQTQLDMMDSPEWGYPYIWSAFMIVGSYESAGITVQ